MEKSFIGAWDTRILRMGALYKQFPVKVYVISQYAKDGVEIMEIIADVDGFQDEVETVVVAWDVEGEYISLFDGYKFYTKDIEYR